MGCKYFILVVDGVLLCLLAAVCLCGNCISLVTWSQVSKLRGRSSYMLLLQTLAVSDSVILLVYVCVISVPENMLAHDDLDNAFMTRVEPYLYKYIYPVSLMANQVTVWITMLITVHRFSMLCYPFSRISHSLTSVKATGIQLVVIVVFSLLYNVPRIFEFDIIVVHQHQQQQNVTNGSSGGSDVINSSHVSLDLSPLYLDKWYQIIYKNASYMILVTIGPLLVTCALTCKIIAMLVSARQQRRDMTVTTSSDKGNTSTSSSERSTSILLVAVVIVFILCQTPYAINRALLVFDKKADLSCGRFLYYFQEICVLLLAINSSTNVFIYAVCSRDFRNAAARMLRCENYPDARNSSRMSVSSVSRRVNGQSTINTTAV